MNGSIGAGWCTRGVENVSGFPITGELRLWYMVGEAPGERGTRDLKLIDGLQVACLPVQ